MGGKFKEFFKNFSQRIFELKHLAALCCRFFASSCLRLKLKLPSKFAHLLSLRKKRDEVKKGKHRVMVEGGNNVQCLCVHRVLSPLTRHGLHQSVVVLQYRIQLPT
jgi:hypothetical protein